MLYGRYSWDVAKSDVHEGATLYIILEAYRVAEHHKRMHYIFDSFEDLSAPSDLEGSHWFRADLSIPLHNVKSNLYEIYDVSYLKGWNTEKFTEVDDRCFSLVHVDVALYKPTLDSVSFFYRRMSIGRILLCDDYSFTNCPRLIKAIDYLLSDKQEK